MSLVSCISRTRVARGEFSSYFITQTNSGVDIFYTEDIYGTVCLLQVTSSMWPRPSIASGQCTRQYQSLSRQVGFDHADLIRTASLLDRGVGGSRSTQGRTSRSSGRYGSCTEGTYQQWRAGVCVGSGPGRR